MDKKSAFDGSFVKGTISVSEIKKPLPITVSNDFLQIIYYFQNVSNKIIFDFCLLSGKKRYLLDVNATKSNIGSSRIRKAKAYTMSTHHTCFNCAQTLIFPTTLSRLL